jgi:hypothetical protein
MKYRIFSLAMMLCAFFAVAAQPKDTTLSEYVGKYSFPEGSFVTTAEITLTDTVLSVASSQGGSVLQKMGKDTFALTAFEGGLMYFYRNSAGKVARIKVEVGDVLLEGSKDGVPTALYNRNRYFDDRKQKQAR